MGLQDGVVILTTCLQHFIIDLAMACSAITDWLSAPCRLSADGGSVKTAQINAETESLLIKGSSMRLAFSLSQPTRAMPGAKS